jgi:hypothetical protein
VKILIAITSCVRDAQNGNNQAIRDTFLKDKPEVEYRFFLGDGTPTGEDETRLRAGVYGAVDPNRGIDYNVKCTESEQYTQSTDYKPQADEITLPVPDDYFHLVYKVRSMHRWLQQQTPGWDFVYKCDTDTYVSISRLLSSGFQNHDFSGGPAGCGNIAGGGGYWLSHKASSKIAQASVTNWAEDCWVSETLKTHGILPHTDVRYSDNPVTLHNDLISTHLGFKPGYNADMMYFAHKRAKIKTNGKALIAINGWVKGATNGDHQAVRDTYAKEIAKWSEKLDLRFFIGDGTPVDESTGVLLNTLHGKWASPGHKEKALSTRISGTFTYTPKEDEVILHVPDGYMYVSYKTKENHRWSVEHGYDSVFQACTDTFINVQRLMESGFEKWEYTGNAIGGPVEPYGSGGCGYWTSGRATQIIIDDPVTDWAEDRWVGETLRKHGITVHHDPRYVGQGRNPNLSNDFITSHLCDTPRVYSNTEMYEAYRLSKLPAPTPPTPPRPIRSPRTPPRPVRG